ncbi:MAG: hypothetical protein ACO1OB_26120 [Archangium sp.]
MRRVLLVSCMTLSACTGLFIENGNTYPCDFSLPPAERDAPCVPGEVCGVENVCKPFIYEGPRFEGPPDQPDYALSGVKKIHPGALSEPIVKLGRDTTARGRYFAQTRDDFAVRVSEKGQLVAATPLPSTMEDPIFGTYIDPQLGSLVGAVGLTNGRLSYSLREGNGTVRSNALGPMTQRVRVSPFPGAAEFLTPEGPLDLPQFVGPTSPPLSLAPQRAWAVTGRGLDVLLVNRQGTAAAPTAVVLTSDGLFSQRADGGFAQLVAPTLPIPSGSLTINAAGTLVAVTLDQLVLSTWQVGLENGEQTLQRAWPDCKPCGTGIQLVTPMPPSGTLGVEVVCRNGEARSLVRVVGSSATLPTDGCETQTLSAPFDFSRAALPNSSFVSAAIQRGVTIGGRNGEIWAGETLSTVQPTSLDRVPLDVATVKVALAGEATQALIGLTERYAAVLPPATPPTQLASGFRRIDTLGDLDRNEEVIFTAAVHGTDGWSLTSNGVIANVRLTEDAVGMSDGLRFGRRLVSPSGQPVTRSAGGEAFVAADGGVLAIYLAADDGLYAVVNPEATLAASSTGSGDVTPQLQPEPSVPIRSLALERTPLGTNGSTRARGYLVTSRNVYEWMLAGTPARWSSRLLQLSGGEPVEVWFDQSRSALGRVGYADGTIITLPGGYQLANPLPGGDGGVPPRVIDYENYGGWPVALTTTGLYAAGWPEVDGVVQNRFDDGRPNRPMDWRPLALPDGGAPWLRGEETKGKLFVQFAGINPMNAKRIFKLYLFLPDQVLLLAEYERK